MSVLPCVVMVVYAETKGGFIKKKYFVCSITELVGNHLCATRLG